MRTDADLTVESTLFADGAGLVAGVDEVGRGAIAGPLVVGAVAVAACAEVLPGLRDSKLLSVKRRALLVPQIQGWAAAWALGVVPAAEVDALGVAAALRTAVARALAGLGVRPDAVIVDGPVDLAGPDYRALPLVGADLRCASVAAASVLAKVWRDDYMTGLEADAAPGHGYGFGQHKGYGTAAHYRAIDAHGLHVEHRRSFKRK